MRKNILFAALMLATVAFAADPILPAWQIMDNPCKGTDADGNPYYFPQTQGGAAIYGDYNNDGAMDMFFCSGNALYLYTNDGTGKYDVTEPDFCEKLFGCAAVWMDYNNDGNLDLIITGSLDETSTGASAYVIQNSGAPDYTLEEDMENFLEGCWPEDKENTLLTIAQLDFDHDGWMDIVLNGQASGDWEEGYDGGRMVALYRNNKGIFELAHGHDTFHQMNGSSVWAGDANNDGYMDLLISGYYDNVFPENPEDKRGGSISEMYINNQKGGFTLTPVTGLIGHQQGVTAFIDFNNDGNQDIFEAGRDVNTGWTPYANVLLGKGDGTFEMVEMNYLTGGAAAAFTFGDLNNDGNVDIAYNGWPTQAVAYGNGDGTFEEVIMQDDAVLDLARARGGYLNFVDFNGDNTLDFYNYGYRDGGDGNVMFSSWPNYQLLNKGAEGMAANAAPSAPKNLKMEKTAKGYKLTWDAAEDDHTAAAAMRYNVFITDGTNTGMIALADKNTGKLRVAGGTLPTLVTGTSYEFVVEEGDYGFGVQAIDQSNVPSAFARVGRTPLSNVKATKTAVKKMVKGMLQIERNNKVYNALGAEL